MEARGDSRSSEDDARPTAAAPRRATGRLVESAQTEEHRFIALVSARPLLYTRSKLLGASYYSQVKRQWKEVADIIGWTVAEARRKWSHLRNSYSRHLRNEVHGHRTGRMVSRWYLADHLEFLRQHMATDTRPSSTTSTSSYSTVMSPYAPALLEVEVSSVEEEGSGGGSVEAGGGARVSPPAWYAAPEGGPRDEPRGFEPDETADYFHFFRGLHDDYQQLTLHAQRTFRRECMLLLHKLVEEERGAGAWGAAADAGEGAADEASDADDDRKCFVQEITIINGAADNDSSAPPAR